jgi:hypothetical protein
VYAQIGEEEEGNTGFANKFFDIKSCNNSIILATTDGKGDESFSSFAYSTKKVAQ